MDKISIVWKVKIKAYAHLHIYFYITEENKQLSSVNVDAEVKSILRLLYMDLDSLCPQPEHRNVLNQLVFIVYSLLGKLRLKSWGRRKGNLHLYINQSYCISVGGGLCLFGFFSSKEIKDCMFW